MQASRAWQNETEVDPLVLVQPSASSLTISGTSSTFSGWPMVGQGLMGQCDAMCPLGERRVRMQDREVAAFEKEGGPTRARVRDLMVKRFARSSAGHENTIEQLRTPATLGATMQYLTCTVLDADSGAPDARFARDGPAQPPSLLQVYNFLFDRTRGIRSDYSSQGYGTGRNDALVMQVYEQIARFHVLSNYELCENKEFQRDLNEKELAKALKTLFDLYDDGHKQHEQAVSKLRHGGASEAHARRTAPHLCSPHEAEMRAFHVLVFMLKDDENTSLNSFLQRCRPEVLQAPPMQYALRAMSLFKGGLHASFLRLMKSGPYLLACLMHRALPAVRIKAAQSLNSGYHVKQDLVLDYVGQQLGAASRAEALSLSQALNLNVLGRGKGHCVRSDRRAEAPQLKSLSHALVPQLMPSLPMPAAGMGRRRSIVCKQEWALASALPVFGKGAAMQPDEVAARVRGLGGCGEDPDVYESGVLATMQQQQQGAFSGAGQAYSDGEQQSVHEEEEEEEDSVGESNDDEDEEEEEDAEESDAAVEDGEESAQGDSAQDSDADELAQGADSSEEEEGGASDNAVGASESPRAGSPPTASDGTLQLRPISPPHTSMLLPGKPLPLTPVADTGVADLKPDFGKSPFGQGSAASALLGSSAPPVGLKLLPPPSTVVHATGLTLPCALGLLSPSKVPPTPSTAPAPAVPPRSLFSAAPSLLGGGGAPAGSAPLLAPPSLLSAGTAQVMSTVNGSLSTGASLLPTVGRPAPPAPAVLTAPLAMASLLARTTPSLAASAAQPGGAQPVLAAEQDAEDAASSPEVQSSPSPPSPPPPPAPVILTPRSWDREASETALQALQAVVLSTGVAVQWCVQQAAAYDAQGEDALQLQELHEWLCSKTPQPTQRVRKMLVTLMPTDAAVQPTVAKGGTVAVYPCTAEWEHNGAALPRGAVALPTRRHMPTSAAKHCLLVDDCGVWEALQGVLDTPPAPLRKGPHPLLEHAALPLLDELVALHHRCSSAQVVPPAVASWLTTVVEGLRAALEQQGCVCDEHWSAACSSFVGAFQRLPQCVSSRTAMQACASAVAELSCVVVELPGGAAGLPPLAQPNPATAGPLVRLPQEQAHSPTQQGAHTPEQPVDASMLQDLSVLDWSFSSTLQPAAAAAVASPAPRVSPKKRRRSTAAAAGTASTAVSRKQRRRSRSSGTPQRRKAAAVPPTWRDIVLGAHLESTQHDHTLDHMVDEVCLDLL